MGALNGLGRFLGPALAPCVLNLCLIAACWAAVWLRAAAAPALAWGLLAAGLGQWLLQQPFLRAAGFRWRGAWRWRDAEARRVGAQLPSVALGGSAHQVIVLLASLLASLLGPGSVAYVYFADQLIELPLGLFGVAVGVAALPSLSALAAAGDMDAFRKNLDKALRLTLYVGLPAAAGLLALAGPVAGLLFGHGAFGPRDAAAAGSVAAFFCLGLPAAALSRPLLSGLYALGANRAAALAAVASAGMFLLAAWPLSVRFGLAGLGLSAAAAAWCHAGLLVLALARRTGRGPAIWRSSLAPGALALVVGLGAWGARLGCSALGWSEAWAVATIPVWAAGYAWASFKLGVEEARTAWGVARRKPRQANG